MDARSVATDIWLMDANQGGLSRFASAPGVDTTPVWSPDDQRMAFSSDRGGIYGALNGFIQAIGTLGKEELVVKNGRIRDWSSDGRYLLYDHRDADGWFRLSVLPLDGTDKAIAYSQDPFNQAQGQFAPLVDIAGADPPRWIAFISNESGDNEVYLQPFPPTSNKIRVSIGGGLEPRWRRDGKELFYIAPGGRLMAVDVKLAADFERGPAKELFKAPIASGGPRAFAFHYDVSPDGQRFLVLVRPQAETVEDSPITIVLNWQAAVKR